MGQLQSKKQAGLYNLMTPYQLCTQWTQSTPSMAIPKDRSGRQVSLLFQVLAWVLFCIFFCNLTCYWYLMVHSCFVKARWLQVKYTCSFIPKAFPSSPVTYMWPSSLHPHLVGQLWSLGSCLGVHIISNLRSSHSQECGPFECSSNAPLVVCVYWVGQYVRTCSGPIQEPTISELGAAFHSLF